MLKEKVFLFKMSDYRQLNRNHFVLRRINYVTVISIVYQRSANWDF